MKKVFLILSVALVGCGSLKNNISSYDHVDLIFIDSVSSAYESTDKPGEFIFIKDTVVIRKTYDYKNNKFHYRIINK
jgi:hypothetical protein